jgi:hypothetical protein
MLRSFLGWKEFDFAWMSVNSFEVGAFPSAVLGADDLFFLVGLHTNKRLIVLWQQELGSSR